MKRIVFVLMLLCAPSCFAQLVLPSNTGIVQAPIDANGWTSYKLVLTQNVTSFSFVILPNGTPPPSQAIRTVEFVENSSGGFTVTFASSINSPCTISTSTNAVTVCQFIYDSVLNTWTGIGGSGGGGGTFGAAFFNVKSSPYNAQGLAQCVTDASVTNNLPGVTSATANFTQAMVGWQAWVYSPGGFSGACKDFGVNPGASTLRCGTTTVNAVVTILSVQSSTAATLSSNCTGGTATNATMVFGPNDYTAISSACAAVPNSGGTVYIPKGGYVSDNSANSNTNPTCQLASTITGSGTVQGDGEGQTFIFIPPWYNHTFNFGSVIANYAFPHGYLRDFTIDLGNITTTPGADTVIDDENPSVDRITVVGADMATGTNEMLYMASGNGNQDNYVNNSTFLGRGNTCIAISGAYTISLVNNFCSSNKSGILITSNGGNSNVSVAGGYYGGNTGNPIIKFPDSGSPSGLRMSMHGTTLCEFGTSSAITANRAGNDAILFLDSVRINDNLGTGGTGGCATGGVGANAPAIINTAGIIHAQKSIIVAAGTGNTINNSGSFFDDGGNTISGGAGYTGTGPAVISASSQWVPPVPTGTGACTTITTQVPSASGTALSGKFTCTGASAASTITLTWLPNAPNGYNCRFADQTTTANSILPTVGTATTCAASAATITANDVIQWSAVPF